MLAFVAVLSQLRPEEVQAQLAKLSETDTAKRVTSFLNVIGRKMGALPGKISSPLPLAPSPPLLFPVPDGAVNAPPLATETVSAPTSSAPEMAASKVARESDPPAEDLIEPMRRLPGSDNLGRTFALPSSLRPDGLSGVINTSLTVSRAEIIEPGFESVINEYTLNLEPIFRTEALGGLTLRSELRGAWVDTSEIPGGLDTEGFRLQRGATTITRDFPESALRLTVGDIFSKPQNFQTVQRLLGFQIGTNYQAIHPYRAVFPSGRQSFQLDRSARVQVFADGVLVAQQLLQPGQFDLEQFASRYGTRNIELSIRDDTGGSTRIDFPAASSMPRLSAGVVDYGLSAGVISRYDVDGPEYQFDQFAASGFVDFGVTSDFTVGADFQVEPSIVTVGLRSIYATDVGAFQLRSSVSIEDDESDLAIGAQYLSPPSERIPAISIDAKYYGEDYPSLREYASSSAGVAIFAGGDPKFEFTASVSDALSDRLRVSLGGNWTKRYSSGPGVVELYPEERWSAFVTSQYKMSKKVRASISLSANQYRIGEDPSVAALLTLTRKLGDDHEAEVSYQSRRQSSAVSLRGDPFSSIDNTSWQLRAERAEKPNSTISFSGEVDHSANRFNAYGTVFEDQREGAFGTTRDAFLQIDTAIGYADGTVAVGRPVRQRGFAIVKAPSSSNGGAVYVDDWGDGEYRAKTSFLGPALIGDILPYTNTKLELSTRPIADGAVNAKAVELISAELLARPVVYAVPYGGVVIDVGELPDADVAPVTLTTAANFGLVSGELK